jgi:hypothetical protein
LAAEAGGKNETPKASLPALIPGRQGESRPR